MRDDGSASSLRRNKRRPAKICPLQNAARLANPAGRFEVLRMTNAPPLASVVDLLLDAICVVDMDGRFLFVSAAFERIFGYRPDEVIGRQVLELVHPDDHPKTLAAVARIVDGDEQRNFENRYLHKDGRIVHVSWSARRSPDHRVRVAVAHDVTERKQSESRQAAVYAISDAAHAAIDVKTLCRRIDDILAPIVPFSDLCVVLHDEERRRLEFSCQSAEWHPAIVEHDSAPYRLSREVVATGTQMAYDGATTRIAPLDDRRGDEWSVEWLGLPLATHDLTFGALLVRAPSTSPPAAADLSLMHFVAMQVASAIERKIIEARLLHGAGHDALTGLANRSLVRDRMTTAVTHARRDGTSLALLYLDIDRFKEVNDRLGHGAGDSLLQELARRLRACVRESDTVGRLGGDEFVVVLAKVQSPEDMTAIAEKVRLAACAGFDCAGESVTVSVSIGLARYPLDGDDYEQLLERADEAMYRSKRRGGNCVSVARDDGDRPA